LGGGEEQKVQKLTKHSVKQKETTVIGEGGQMANFFL